MQVGLLDRLLVTLAVRLRSFSVCRIQQGWRLGFSPFEAITIHYVLRGRGSLRVGNGHWQEFGPHSALIVPARQSHVLGEAIEVVGEVKAEDHCSLHGDGLVTFAAGDGSPDILLICGQISASYDGALGLFELFRDPIVEVFSEESGLQRSFDLMLAEVAAPTIGTQAMTEVLMKQCLIVLLRQHLTKSFAASPFLTVLQEPRLAGAVVAILEQPGAAYSVEGLATLVGMSRTSFSERFSEVFEQSPMEFVQKVRLRVAARLLASTDLPVKVIANTVGYASRSSFSQVFEATYGAAPATFRKFGGMEEGESESLPTPFPSQ